MAKQETDNTQSWLSDVVLPRTQWCASFKYIELRFGYKLWKGMLKIAFNKNRKEK